jgi:hypothetical protein
MTGEVFARVFNVELLCLEAPALEKRALLNAIRIRCPGAEPLDPTDRNLPAFVHRDHPIQLLDAQIAAQTLITASERPVSLETYGPALGQSWSFPQARDVVARCRHAVLVTDVMTSSLEYRARLDLFQRALRGVLEVVPCVAVHWPHSQRIVDPQVWLTKFDAGNQAELLGAGALNVRLFNVEGPGAAGGEAVMDTLGLGALGLPDLQVHFSKRLDPGDVARVLLNTACYVFEHGDVIEDGHTIGGIEPHSKWRCRHEIALVAPDRAILDLDPGKPYSAGKRAG